MRQKGGRVDTKRGEDRKSKWVGLPFSFSSSGSVPFLLPWSLFDLKPAMKVIILYNPLPPLTPATVLGRRGWVIVFWLLKGGQSGATPLTSGLNLPCVRKSILSFNHISGAETRADSVRPPFKLAGQTCLLEEVSRHPITSMNLAPLRRSLPAGGRINCKLCLVASCHLISQSRFTWNKVTIQYWHFLTGNGKWIWASKSGAGCGTIVNGYEKCWFMWNSPMR